MVSAQQQSLAAVLLSALVLAQCVSPSASFASATAFSRTPSPLLATAEKEAATVTDDLLKPPYEIEPIPLRIGHGFDIHRMAPLEEAGQPVVIGGVEIPHKDQKVRLHRTQIRSDRSDGRTNQWQRRFVSFVRSLSRLWLFLCLSTRWFGTAPDKCIDGFIPSYNIMLL